MATAAEGCELWRECVRWLVDVGVLRSDHKVAQPEGTPLEFATLLRDGILLCRMINDLIPGSIDCKEFPQQQVNHMSEFQCQKVICLFLGACQKTLDLKEEEMFVACDLYRMTNFAKVLDTLSIISYSEPAIRRGIDPFPPQTGSITCRVVAHTLMDAEEDIYRNLQDDVDNVELDSSIYDVGPYKSIYGEESTKIYDHIVARQDSRREFKTDPWSQFSPISKREHCIKEMLDTERNYVEKALAMIMNKFHSPMSVFLKEKDCDTIFMNISELWNLHISFQSDLQEAVFRTLNLHSSTNGRPMSLNRHIGDVFILHKEKFIAYGPYCMGLDNSRAKILELEKTDSNIKTKILECTANVNDNQFKLQDLLCLPMQRVLKYHILLSELIKATTIDSPDRKSLELAKEAMEDVNAYVNEMKRDHETCELIQDVEKSIHDLIMPENISLKDYGRLNTDCEVRLSQSTERESGKMKQRHIFVFDKVLIICQSKKNNTYVYKGAYVLNELNIDLEGAHCDNKFGTITKKLAAQNLVHLVRDLRNDRLLHNPEIKYLTLSFKTRPLMEKWITQFKTARDNVSPPEQKETGHKMHYQTFKTNVAHKCQICERFLRGLIFQGYKCESCGGVFHRSCVGMRPCTGRRSSNVTPTASFSFADHRRRPLSPCIMNDPMTIIYNPFEAVMKSEKKVNLNRSCWDSVVPLTDRSNWVTFEDDHDSGVFCISTHDKLPKQQLSKGDQVVVTSRIAMSDPSYLRLEPNEVVEVLQILEDGIFLGCPISNKSRTGLVSSTHVRRLRTNSVVGIGLNTPVDGHSIARIDRKESTVLPRRPANVPPTPQPDYMNTEVTSQTWYMGCMERAESEKKLKPTPNGTFLVRFSNNRGRYALSISYEGEVKHTVIEQSDEGKYFLDEGYVFNSIVELVNYYKKNNLCESFNSLNTVLRNPYRDCKVYRVIHDFEQTEAKFLSIKKGDVLTLIDTIGEERGWWKGALQNRVGFFPMSYVEEVREEETR